MAYDVAGDYEGVLPFLYSSYAGPIAFVLFEIPSIEA
jgi:hypothetical protein